MHIFLDFKILSELHNLNLELCSKQYCKINLLQLIVVPQLSGGWHNYSTKTRKAGHAYGPIKVAKASTGIVTIIIKDLLTR